MEIIHTAMKTILSCFYFVLFTSFSIQDDFLKDQRRYPRVREAIAEKQMEVAATLEHYELQINNFHMLLVAYKDEDRLILYAKSKTAGTYLPIEEYEICSRSGILGPKRRQGDYQVPEGFYYIDRFNPASNFHLSIGLNYPNLADQRKSTFDRLGGDIFIHGSCVTIGCLPMTDDKIKEIYLYAIHARNNGQVKVPVYIFPFQMTDENMVSYSRKHSENQELLDFWNNLKLGYDLFVQNKHELNLSVRGNGDYEF